MFRNIGKKLKSFTLIEILIVMVIVGILAVVYMKLVDRKIVVAKFAFRDVYSQLQNMAATLADHQYSCGNSLEQDSLLATSLRSITTNIANCGTVENLNADAMCRAMSDFFNTVGGAPNCVDSTYIYNESATPRSLANFTTTSGMRFYGLEVGLKNDYSTIDRLPYLLFTVDLDGLKGNNEIGDDIVSFEVLDDGTVRPSGEAAVDSTIFPVEAIYAHDSYNDANAFEFTGTNYTTMGRNLSYAEAQCLTGNPFPFRNINTGYLSFCVSDPKNTEIETLWYDYLEAKTQENLDAYYAALTAYKSDATIINKICSNQLYTDGMVGDNNRQRTTAIYDLCKKCYNPETKSLSEDNSTPPVQVEYCKIK